MRIPMKELNNKVPDIKSENSSLYFLSEKYVAKRFQKCYGQKQKDRFQRYQMATQMHGIENLILPIDILETEKGFCGYIEPVIPGTIENQLTTFTNYINHHQTEITLEEIADYILKCNKIVKQSHENGIINPDMSSERNVLYNPVTNEVYFTDYQDMQVKNIPSNVISSFIALDPILETSKYQKEDQFTTNIDLYTLAIRFFYYTTKINIPRAIHGYEIGELLDLAGISNTAFGECMKVLYDQYKNNIDICEPIKELSREYKLTPFQNNQVRKLIKK